MQFTRRLAKFVRPSVVVTVLSVAVGCRASVPTSGAAARPEGCDVQVFFEVPPMPTENIGPVNAICGEEISRDDCLRTLQDAVCRLGGDVVWGVARKPSLSLGKQRFDGRAAHTRAPK